MSDFEESVLKEISDWAVKKYGAAAIGMEHYVLAEEYWKEKLE